MMKQNDLQNKPLISILMAVYEPRMDWLREQLDSLEAQNYPNLRLYVRDDCSQTVSFEAICECVKSCIHSIPFQIKRNEKNRGSNETFECLTREAEGDYFAYCDQDDIWLPEKIATLEEVITRENALLVCSDMFIIDENGRQSADSITKVRRHHVFKSGEGLAPQLLISNFVTGCTMLIDANAARKAAPFCPYMVHDHYLALWCARKSKIVSKPDKLIRYRIHTNNQTTLMSGVVDKESYVDIRIRKLVNRLRWLQNRFDDDDVLSEKIEQALEWAEARESYFLGDMSAIIRIWKFRDISPQVSLFEIILAKASEGVFMKCIQLAQKNMI